MVAGAPVTGVPELEELREKDVGGGVEMEALAPVCAETCNAQVKERKNAKVARQSIVHNVNPLD